MKSHNYDVAIVGGGAAGLSAALVLARSRRKLVIVVPAADVVRTIVAEAESIIASRLGSLMAVEVRTGV